MPQTKSALIQEVVAELSALGSGQSANADQIAFVEARIAPIVDELSKGRIITIANIEAIPDFAFPDLVRIVAEECSPKFLRPTDKAKLDAARASLAQLARLDRSASPLVLAVLERLDALKASSPAVDATAVSGRLPRILADLATRNVIYIPDVATVEDDAHPAFDALVDYVAGRFAPQLAGMKDEAEGRLRTIQRIGKGTGGPLKVDAALRPYSRRSYFRITG